MARLLTAQQVADTFGIPSARTVRTMRADGLPAVRLGKCYLFEVADVEAFIESRKETKCRARTEDRTSNTLGLGDGGTSSGPSPDARGSTARALAIAQKLKTRSLTSSKAAVDRSEPGRVILGAFRSAKP